MNEPLTTSLSRALRFMRDKRPSTSRPSDVPRMTAMTSEELGISTPAEKAAAARRRDATRRVREARDRLTSTTGTRPAFDYELLRQFAQNRLSASLVILLLVGSVGALSSIWIGALTAGTWTSAVLVIHAVIITKCRQFLLLPQK